MSKAQFLLSAASAAQFPATGLPEIALVGRSNVGKSSLINALTKQKIARTSAAPGKTRLANYYLLTLQASGSRPPASGSRVRDGGEFYLVDLPGYGYARGGEASAQAFEQLTREYFARTERRRRIAGVLQLVDARHPDLPQDGHAFEWLAGTGIPVAIAATKIDKLNQSEQATIARMLTARYGVPILPVSSLSGAGLPALWKALARWLG